MGTLIFTAFLLLSGMAQAEPFEMAGVWSLNGGIRSAYRIFTISQKVYTEEDRQKLAELEEQGYVCIYFSRNTYRCRNSDSGPWEISDEHRQKLLSGFVPQSFELVRVAGEPKVVSQGRDVTQWSMPLHVYSSQHKSHSLVCWEMASGLLKLQFSLGGEEYWPYFEGDSDKMNFRTFLVEASGNQTTHYYYDVVFSR